MGGGGRFITADQFRQFISDARIQLSRFSHSTFFKGVDTSLHKARFARSHELERLLGGVTPEFETSLLLGRGEHGRILRVIPTPLRRELGNMLVVAPTRGGKGLLATAQLLTWPHSVVVNDIKGDLFEQTAGFRSQFSDIYVIDPNGFGNRYNPLSGKTNHKDLLAAAFSLLRRYGDSEGLIFFERGSVMLQQILIAALIEAEEARKLGQPVLAPLPYVQQMIYLGLPHAAQRLDDLSKAYGIYPNLATQLLESPIGEADLSDRFLLSCWATMTTKMRFLLSDPAVRSFTGSDFTAKNLLSAPRPVTVYIRIPEEDVSVLAPLVRLMWDSIISDLLKIYDEVKGVNCRPVLLLIDEAGITGVPRLEERAATVAGRQISLWVAVQDLAQLTKIYGRDGKETILNNMKTKIFYQQDGEETLDYLVKRLGRKSVFAHSKTKHGSSETAQGEMEQAVSLLTAQEISELDETQIIGFHHNLKPFLAKRMDWRDYPHLSKLRNIKPPPVAPLEETKTRLPEIEQPRFDDIAERY